MRRLRLAASGALIATMLLGVLSSESSAGDRKIALLFNLDQGFPAGIVENDDMNGLDRALTVLEKFKHKYDVYVIFSPLTAKANNLRDELRTAAAHQVPFFLDVYTSDAVTMGNILTPANPQADPSHALTTSVDALRTLKSDREIGPYFAGIRIFEVMAEDFTVKTCLSPKAGAHVDWCDHFQHNVTTSEIFTRERAKGLLDFAKSNRMLVFWSDWKWDAQTEAQQKIVVDLLSGGDYRDTVILAYANNLPNEIARTDDSNWRAWVSKYSPMVGRAIRAIGLSDQAWLCDANVACPEPVIQSWVERAVQAGAVAIQFEPANYFFELPKGGNQVGYPNSPVWHETSGRPSEQLALLARSLGADLGTAEPAPLAYTTQNRTVCMSVDLDQHPVTAGQLFKGSVTFHNGGANPWEPHSMALVPLSQDVWRIGAVSLPDRRIQPGQDVQVPLSGVVPAKPGFQRLDLGLKTKEGFRFDDFCSLLVSIGAQR
jgi:hypothetical protein